MRQISTPNTYVLLHVIKISLTNLYFKELWCVYEEACDRYPDDIEAKLSVALVRVRVADAEKTLGGNRKAGIC